MVDIETLKTDTMFFTAISGMIAVVYVPMLMKYLKKMFPRWDKKAWAPPIIGGISTLIAAMAAGQVTSWQYAAWFFVSGLGAGGFASSARDVVNKK